MSATVDTDPATAADEDEVAVDLIAGLFDAEPEAAAPAGPLYTSPTSMSGKSKYAVPASSAPAKAVKSPAKSAPSAGFDAVQAIPADPAAEEDLVSSMFM